MPPRILRFAQDNPCFLDRKELRFFKQWKELQDGAAPSPAVFFTLVYTSYRHTMDSTYGHKEISLETF